MRIQARLARFARKPVPDQWAAVKTTLASVSQFGRRSRRAQVHASAENIAFASGLGDSANLLYGLVRSMKPETCVEIGSAQGKSACYIGAALKENRRGKLYAIDPHIRTEWNDTGWEDTIDIFRENISTLGLSEQVVMIRSLSEDAARNWDRQIDLLFIDGDHSYDGVRRDWTLFVPHVKPFGIVVFHDTIWGLTPDLGGRPDMGVPRFVDELRCQGYQAVTIDKDCGVTLIQPSLGGLPLQQPTTGGSAALRQSPLAGSVADRDQEDRGKSWRHERPQ
jgi:predicted O-methyltransferase YrrM